MVALPETLVVDSLGEGFRLIPNYGDRPTDDATTFRRAIWQNGFRPVQVRTGEKRPAEPDWRNVALDHLPPCLRMDASADPAALNTGILCDGLRVIDIDVEDAEIVDQIEALARDLLGDTLTRFRNNSPRLALVYRAADGAPPKSSVKGHFGQIEVLGNGQQVVAHGVHPSGSEYRWRGGSPATVRREDIPAVSEEDVQHFLADAERLLGAVHVSPASAEAPRAARLQAGMPTLPVAIAKPSNVHEHPLVDAWARGALRNEVEAVATWGRGGRNNRLNNAALALGEFVPGGFLTESEVRTQLEGACRTNGLWEEDGPPQCGATISSGLKAGMEKPRAIPASILAKIAAQVSERPPHYPETGEVFDAPAPLHQPAQLPTVCAAHFEGRPIPPREWLAEGIVPARTVTLLTGDGGVGKSLVALQCAVSVALGTPWLGIEVKHGPALFLTAEDELDEIHRRLAAVARALPCPLGYLGKLHIASLVGEDALLATQERSNSKIVQATALFGRLKARVDALKPALVVLDTLADLFGGEENDRAQARQFIGLLRGLAMKCETTVVLLAHPSLSGMASGTGSSGSTAWSNSVRSRLYLYKPERIEGREADPHARILEVMKANYSKAGTRFTLRWQDGVLVREDGVDEATGETRAAQADRVFANLLAIYRRQSRRVSSAKSPTYAPSVFARDHRAAGLTSQELTNAMNRLLDRGVIHVVEEGSPSKRRSYLEVEAAGRDDADEMQSQMDE